MQLIKAQATTRVMRPGEPLAGAPKISKPLLAPENRRLPYIISEGAAAGDVQTAVPGSWAANPPASTTYQWRKDALDIVGATGLKYTIQLADAGTTITCRETATNSEGTASVITSNSVVVPL